MVLGATLAIGSGAALYGYVAGNFVVALQASTGWSRTEIAAVALGGFLSAALTPFIGALIGRVGPRRAGAAALILVGLGYLALAGLPARLPYYYAIHVFFAVVGPASTALAFTPAVVTRFRASRGLALAVSLSGAALAAVVVSPLLIALIGAQGWRAGYAVLAAIAILVGVPAVLGLLGPSSRGLIEVAGKALRPCPWSAALRTRAYCLLMAGTLLACLPLGGFLGQLQPLLADDGMPSTGLKAVASAVALSVVAGRFLVGALLDCLEPRLVAAGALLTAAGGAALLGLAQGDLRLTILAVALIGGAQGAESDLVAYFTARHFDLGSYSTIFASLVAVIALAIPAGSVLFAAAHDQLGTYEPAIWSSVGAFMAAAICFLLLGRPARGD